MVKIKEYSIRLICILSVIVCFLMTVFCPFDIVLANEELVGSIENSTSGVLFQINDTDITWSDNNVNAEIEHTVSETTGGTYNYTRFKKLYISGYSFTSQPDIYAYKIIVTPTSVSLTNNELVDNARLVVGNFDDLVYCDGVYGYGLDATAQSIFWLQTGYEVMPIYLGAEVTMHQTDIPSGSGYITSYPSVVFTGNYTVYYKGYTVDDMTDELYQELLQNSSDNADIIDKLDSIYNSTDTVETKLQSLVDIANKILVNTNEAETILYTCRNYLNDINSKLTTNNNYLSLIYSKLCEFFNAFKDYIGLSGDNSDVYEEAPEDSQMTDLNTKEDELLGDTDPDAAADDLTVEIDADSSAVIWELLNKFVTANGTVFGSFISMLSLGVVALILGR